MLNEIWTDGGVFIAKIEKARLDIRYIKGDFIKIKNKKYKVESVTIVHVDDMAYGQNRGLKVDKAVIKVLESF